MIAKFYTKTIILLLINWLPLLSFSQTISIGDSDLKEPMPLKPFFEIAEDGIDSLSANNIYLNPTIFTSLSQFKLIEPDHSFWLRTNIQTSPNLNKQHASIFFNHLTFVDLYLYRDGKNILHRQAGAFRERKFIAPEDSRFAFSIILEPDANYTLLLKVKHTKKYPPDFDFVLQDSISFLSSKHRSDLANTFLLGAIVILLLYTTVLWLFNRYRPYLWLLMFILGIGLYGFALRPSFIDIFFSQQPKIGWLFVFSFLHLGIIGLYLLLIDFLDMRKNAPLLYMYGRYLVKIMITFSFFILLNNSITANYFLSNKLNLLLTPIHLIYIASVLIYLRKKLSSAQRYLIYGLLMFVFNIAIISINSFLFHEQSLLSIPIAAKSTICCISLFFLAGLHKQFQQHEQEKIIALEQLNELHQQYNVKIEMKVEERTLALKTSNVKLVEQQTQLIEKNSQIETLIDEVNHRVKNNLQVLYSLNTLQLPLIKDVKGKQILNEMRGRIKAMMVANEHLHDHKRDQSITLSIFINEISGHLQQIYDPKKQIEITAEVPEDFKLSAIEALPFGLLLTELFTNTYKHAFTPLHPQPQIRLNLHLLNEQLQFIFEDNGQGADHLVKKTSMGIPLIQDLTRQLKGTVTIQHQQGFSYQFTFSNSKHYAHINH